MKIKLVIWTIVFFNSYVLFSQSKDTLYYDKNWDECSSELAFYYGIKDLDSSRSGIENYYYLTGEKHSQKSMKDGSESGNTIWWYKNGQKWCVGNYKMGIENGLFTYWYPNGKMKEEGIYKNGIQVLKGWKYYDESGYRLYSKWEVDDMPLFMNAKNEKKSIKLLFKYLHENIKYPDNVMEKGIKGRVLIGFTINENGNVIDVVLIDGINYYLDEEAKKIVENLPKWQPAVYDGKNVRVRYSIPINFKLN